MGVGRLRGWRWQINERGVGNIIESPDDYVEGVVYDIDKGNRRQLDRNEGVSKGFYSAMEMPIEFIPLSEYRSQKTGYVARMLENVHPCPQDCAGSPTQTLDEQAQEQTSLLSQSPASEKVVPAAAAWPPFEDSSMDLSETVKALVYVSRDYITDGNIRAEYVDRMEKAIKDGHKLGLSAHFLHQVSQCIHSTQPQASDVCKNPARPNPSQRETPRGAPSNRGHHSNKRSRIEPIDHSEHIHRTDHASNKHPAIVKVSFERFTVTEAHDRVRLPKRRRSNHVRRSAHGLTR